MHAVKLRGRGPATRNAAVTVVGGVAAQIPILVSGIVVARALGVEDRGHLAFLWVVALVLAFLAAAGIPLAVTYWTAREPARTRSLARLVLRVGLIQAGVATLVQAAVLWVTVGGEDASVREAALVSLVALPAMIAVMHTMAFLQGLSRFTAWTAVRLLPPFVYTGAVLALAAAGSANLLPVTAVWVASWIVAAFVAVRLVARALPAGEEPGPPFSELQRFGARGFLGTASPSDTLQLDQILVALFLSPRALGLYVVALAFTNLPRLVAQSIGFVAYPHVARQADPREARRAMWCWAAVALAAASAIVIVLEVTAGPLVRLLFGDVFGPAIHLTRLVLVAAVLVGVRRVLADGARGAGRPGLGTIAEVASTVVLFPAMAVGAGALGTDGVALALVVAGAVGLGVLLVGLVRRPLEAEPAVAPPLVAPPVELPVR